MRRSELQYLACPRCLSDLNLHSITECHDDVLVNAKLECPSCSKEYPVLRGIPRFVSDEKYASSFGFEWIKHAKTQYDSYSGLQLSEKRFFEETRWSRNLAGQVILEVGSGSGRFTEQAASTGAFIVSMDYSCAVDANFESNGRKTNVLVVQGDVYQMPFRPESFDKVFCFGMLQHTPRVYKAFLALLTILKGGGELAIDIYKKTFFTTILSTKYYVRLITRRINPGELYRLTKQWVDLMWPICGIIGGIPRIGPSVNWRLLVADHRREGLRGNMLKEWAYLDTFDMIASYYDKPQTIQTVQRWFAGAGLLNVEVSYGYNGIVGRGRKPICAA